MDKALGLKRMIQRSRNVVFFTGAGISTESGIPDSVEMPAPVKKTTLRLR